MSKLNTEACIECICKAIKDVADFDEANTNKSNWKRVSKRGNSKDGFVRVFKNKVSDMSVEIRSSDTDFLEIAFIDKAPVPALDPVPAPTPVVKPVANGTVLMVPPNKYMFHIKYNPNPDTMFMEHKFTVCINTKRYWKEKRCLNDNDQYWDEPLVYDALEDLKLEGMSEATYDTDDYDSLEDLKTALISRGFFVDQDFWDFMEQCS
jgi:hypothetical protein